ncbi:hypothetical protein IAQ61_002083 [Plenodomus lingam]|uniref:uncharacterized protein n=1 Tax=Leptosphaeria maculans TaxID=5022 RepID=UPI00332B8385|nr:hypothetical protein IAQ61_002083 [Plenodomus lingam]
MIPTLQSLPQTVDGPSQPGDSKVDMRSITLESSTLDPPKQKSPLVTSSSEFGVTGVKGTNRGIMAKRTKDGGQEEPTER